MSLTEWAVEFYRDEEGASVVEYAMLIALIIAICIGVIFTFGQQIKESYNDFAKAYEKAVK